MLEIPFIVVFTVSSSVQSIPKAVRATRPIIALIAALLVLATDKMAAEAMRQPATY